jgi:hypothetical protein
MAGTRIATLGVSARQRVLPFARFRNANAFAADHFCIVLFSITHSMSIPTKEKKEARRNQKNNELILV